MSEGALRKSSRQPVPNRIYSQGINDLKKVNQIQVQENTYRNKKKIKNNQQSNHSNQQQNQQIIYQHPFHSNDSRQPYLPCRMPNGLHKKIKFVVGYKEEQKKKQKHEQHEKQPTPTLKPSDKNKKTPDLLNIFKTAIQKIDNANDTLNDGNQPQNKTPPQRIELAKPPPPKQKRTPRIQGQDFIKKIKIQNHFMKIINSQLQQILIPIQWQDQQKIEQENPEIEEIKKKLQHCQIIKNISILTT